MGTQSSPISSLYYDGHLFVAAIRILEKQNSKTPTIGEICQIMSISPEKGNLIARKLLDMGIVKKISGAHEIGFIIENHLKIEELHRYKQEDGIDKEIKRFISSKEEQKKKIEIIRDKSKKKKKKLFDGIETQLKKNIN